MLARAFARLGDDEIALWFSRCSPVVIIHALIAGVVAFTTRHVKVFIVMAVGHDSFVRTLLIPA
jgi:hypothetical protein